MDTNKYRIIITPTASKEIYNIYYYIYNNLCAKKAARDLMKLVDREIQRLKCSPKIHQKIEINGEVKRKYRRIVIKNFVILYTIDEFKNIVYVSHMYFGSKDYL